MFRFPSIVRRAVIITVVASGFAAPAVGADPSPSTVGAGCLPVGCAAGYLHTSPHALAADVTTAAAASGTDAMDALLAMIDEEAATRLARLAPVADLPRQVEALAVYTTMNEHRDVRAAVIVAAGMMPLA